MEHGVSGATGPIYTVVPTITNIKTEQWEIFTEFPQRWQCYYVQRTSVKNVPIHALQGILIRMSRQEPRHHMYTASHVSKWQWGSFN